MGPAPHYLLARPVHVRLPRPLRRAMHESLRVQRVTNGALIPTLPAATDALSAAAPCRAPSASDGSLSPNTWPGSGLGKVERRGLPSSVLAISTLVSMLDLGGLVCARVWVWSVCRQRGCAFLVQCVGSARPATVRGHRLLSQAPNPLRWRYTIGSERVRQRGAGAPLAAHPGHLAHVIAARHGAVVAARRRQPHHPGLARGDVCGGPTTKPVCCLCALARRFCSSRTARRKLRPAGARNPAACPPALRST